MAAYASAQSSEGWRTLCGIARLRTGGDLRRGGAREATTGPRRAARAREPAALAAAVRELLAAPPDQQKVRRCAEKFSWDRNAEALEAHLRGVVEASPLRAA